MFKYIFFDLDGTLTDSAEGITKCVQYALESRGINVPDLNTLRPFIGPPLIESFMKFYGMTEEEARLCTAKYRERFKRHRHLRKQSVPRRTGNACPA